ncbi:cysteine peptidase family C39 domain-containing protein [Synechococcus sp. A10-1-5-9]|uniref:cysteine peptidase family C39 domain-containing protein n=1 Tax=Synechococcus sp. A10-1-5-9 TaxID=3392295 RepID=UPI0039E81DB5
MRSIINLAQELFQRINRHPPFPLAIQSDETECGLASLTMVLRGLGSTCELERLRVLYGSTRGGMTVGELCEFAATVGLRGIPARLEEDKLEKTPSIIFVRTDHFSVLWKIQEDAKQGRTYHIADPSDGILCFGEEDFIEYYSGLQITFRPIKRIFENQDLTQAGHVSQKLSSLLIGKTVIVLLICILASVSAVLALLNAGAQDVFMTYVVEEGEILWTRGLILVTIALSVLIALSSLMMQVAVQRQLQTVIQAWNIDLFKSLFTAPYSFFINKTTGLIASRFSQVEEALSGYQSAVLAAFTGCLNLLVYVIAVMLVSTPLALVSAAGIAAFIYVGLKFYGYNIQNNYMIREAECVVATAEFKLIKGREQIILEHAEDATQRELTAGYASLGKAELATSRIGAINELFLGSIDQSLNALLLVVSSILIVNGNLTTGTYAAINVIIGTALEPIRSLSQLLETFQNSRLTFQSAAELRPPTKTTTENNKSANESLPAKIETAPLIELQSVTYRYSKYSEPILNAANLKIRSKSGRPLAIRLDGDSGSGKSTLLNLLMGLISPVSGQVSICGANLARLKLDDKRKIVQYVDRSALIVRGTVEFNARLGTHASHEDYEQTLSGLGLAQEAIFSQQNARLLQDETSVSTGQSVMISIIRAALMKPQLLLIDESLVSIPQELHKPVLQGLLKMRINTLVVQHGDSPVISNLPTIAMRDLQKEAN